MLAESLYPALHECIVAIEWFLPLLSVMYSLGVPGFSCGGSVTLRKSLHVTLFAQVFWKLA